METIKEQPYYKYGWPDYQIYMEHPNFKEDSYYNADNNVYFIPDYIIKEIDKQYNNTLEGMCRYTDEVIDAIFENNKKLIMNKEQYQDKLWLELSEESRERIVNDYLDLLSDTGRWVNDYTDEERGGAIAQIEWTFGPHNLKPTLTYEDVSTELFGKNNEKQYGIFSCHVFSDAHCDKISAINALICVAKYLNEDWKPDLRDENAKFYTLGIDNRDNSIKIIEVRPYYTFTTEIVSFEEKEFAEQAIQILGEETIKLALSTEY